MAPEPRSDGDHGRSADRRPDRRVGRTRRLLKDALLDLIREVGYDRITISMLTDRADVGRSTFYSHYDSKEDLLLDGFDTWVLQVGEAPEDATLSDESGGAGADDPDTSRQNDPSFRFARPLLHHVADQRRFFRSTMVEARSTRLRRRIVDMFAARARNELGRMGRDTSDAAAYAVAGAFLEVVTWWLDAGSGTPIDEVETAFQRAVGAAD